MIFSRFLIKFFRNWAIFQGFAVLAYDIKDDSISNKYRFSYTHFNRKQHWTSHIFQNFWGLEKAQLLKHRKFKQHTKTQLIFKISRYVTQVFSGIL